MIKNLQQKQFIQGHQERIWDAKWHPNGIYLATSSADKSIKIWKFENKYYTLTMISTANDAHEKSVRAIQWSPDGSHLASASFDGFVSIWKFCPENIGNEFEKITSLDGHESEVKSVSWSSCNKYLASCSRDKRIIIWDITNEGMALDLSVNDILEGHTQDVKCVLWEPSGDERLYSASYDNSIRVWGNQDDEWECLDLVEHESTVWDIKISLDSKILISGSADLTCRIWAVGNGKIKPLAIFPNVHRKAIYSVDIKGSFVISAGGDNMLALYSLGNAYSSENQVEDKDNSSNIVNQSLLTFQEAHDNDINRCIFHPEFQIIVTVGDDELMKIWDFSQFN